MSKGVNEKRCKEGAISECTPFFYNLTGGSKIYKNGDITETDETFNGNLFFKKYFMMIKPIPKDI